ncbi:FAD-dependent monooxygenase [Actinomadura sediminis]|uniref:FAD-dependent monooxygenase n=1 Tax=Actinomadura sediminis TaxID=1038904 RepID=A0ABW3ET85_9ACTN
MRVVVCGAGLTGLALAGRIAALGGEVLLLERARGPRTQGYMIDFFGPGYDAVDAMGLRPAVERVAYPVSEAVYVDERGRRRASVEPAQFASGPLLNLMRPDLERVLREALPGDVELRFGTGPAAVDARDDGVRVTLEDGTDVDADLLVGADGVHSTVRRLVFGDEPRFVRHLGFHTAAFTFEAPDVHARVEGRAYLTDTVRRLMGFYALRPAGGSRHRVAAFGVHRTPDPQVPDDVVAAVRAAYGDLGWAAPTALDRMPPAADVYYDQVAQTVVPRWSRGRVVLAGDACHAVSLLAGQGASLGIAGAYLLGGLLAGEGPADRALARYEELWRPVVEEKQRTGRSAARWFLPATPLQLRTRRVALRLARLPVADRGIAALLAGESTSLIRDMSRAEGTPG